MAETDAGFGGGYGMWAIILFFLLAWGNGGFGGGFGNNGAAQAVANYATQADITNGFNFNSLSNGIQNVERGICSLGYDNLAQINNATQSINGSIAGVNNSIVQANFAMQQGFANLGYQNATNTCAITTNATANTQAILNKLCDMEKAAKDETIYSLRTDLQAAQLQLGNVAQTQNIVSQLKPVPVPAYITCSPYTTSNYCGCNA